MKNEKKLLKIFKKIIKNSSINSTIQNTPEWDSLNHIKIINLIEKNFDIKIKLNDYVKLISFKKILIFLNKIS